MPLPARPRISLLAPPLIPGRTATVTVVLDARKATRIDFVDLFVHAIEGAVAGPTTTPLRLGARLRNAGELRPGRTELPCRIDVPTSIAPTYAGSWFHARHEAAVHVSIPYWPDARASFQLIARPAPRAPRQWDGLLFSSEGGGAPVSGPYAELSLVTRSISPGSVLTGAVALYNVASCRYDRVIVAVRQIERFGGQTHVAASWQIELGGERFAEGQRVEFALRVPALAPTMRVGTIDVQHELLVTARSAWSELLHMPIPIEVLPDPVEAALRTAPALGDERARVFWERVAERTGLALEHDALVRRHRGRVITVHRDLTRRAPLLVAEVRHPALGLGLRSTPRAGLSWLAGRGPEAGVGAIDRRLALEARCRPQAERYLGSLGRALTSILSGRMTIDAIADDRIAVALADSGTTEAPIAAVAQAALALDAVMEAAIEAVPLPPPLDGHAEAWTALAARMGATLERGSATLAAAAEDAEVRIRPVFDASGHAVAIRAARREPTALEVGGPIVAASPEALGALRDEARRAGGALLERGGELSIDAHELSYTALLGTEWAPADAAMRAERALAGLSQLAASLRPQRGPFR
jgi:hypothetical protein